MKFTEKEMKALISNQAQVAAAYEVSSDMGLVPLLNNETDKYELSAVLYMGHKTQEKTHITYLSTTGKDKWYIGCSNNAFLEGTLVEEEMKLQIADVICNIPDTNKEEVIEILQSSFGMFKKPNPCAINKRLMSNIKSKQNKGDSIEDISRSGSVFCEHVKNMFSQMDNFDEVSKNLYKMLKEAKSASSMKRSDSAIEDALDNFGFQGEAAFIAGPGGHGKTHTVKGYAEKHDLAFIELQGHGQIEAIDMYGYDKKVGDQLVWFDGPISQAARLAASGTKTLLFIDEFVNIPMRETAGLKASFEPYKGFYYFQTSRVASVIDGIATMEEIKVPVENLQIVAAANIGSGYASEEVDKALKQRFMFLHYEATNNKIKKVLTSICKEKGFSLSLVEQLMSFKTLMELKVKEGELEEAPTMRHLSRKFLGLMKSEDELEEVAKAQILQFVEFDVDGRPVEEQVEIVEEIIEATLV